MSGAATTMSSAGGSNLRGKGMMRTGAKRGGSTPGPLLITEALSRGHWTSGCEIIYFLT